MVFVNQSEHILYLAFDCNLFTWLETFLLIWILFLINCRKKWLPQQLRKLSHSKTDKLPVDKSILKKGSEKKIKVSTDEVSWWKIYYKKMLFNIRKSRKKKAKQHLHYHHTLVSHQHSPIPCNNTISKLRMHSSALSCHRLWNHFKTIPYHHHPKVLAQLRRNIQFNLLQIHPTTSH